MTDATIARIRTGIATAVATALTFLLNWLATKGLDIDIDANAITVPLATAIVGFLAALYTALVNALARRWPILGRGLGINATPSYPSR